MIHNGPPILEERVIRLLLDPRQVPLYQGLRFE